MTHEEFETFYTQHVDKWTKMVNAVVKDHDKTADLLQDTCVYFLDGRLGKLSINPDSMVRMKLFWMIGDYIHPAEYKTRNVASQSLSLVENFDDERRNNALAVDPCSYIDIPTLREQGIDEAVATLPETWQDIVRLKACAGLPWKEISTITKIPTGTLMPLYQYTILPALRLALANVGIEARTCDDNTTHGTTENVVSQYPQVDNE